MAYIVKLNIELTLADLIAKIVRARNLPDAAHILEIEQFVGLQQVKPIYPKIREKGVMDSQQIEHVFEGFC